MKLFEIEKCDAAIEHYKKSCGFLRRGRINSFFFGGQAGIGSYQQDIQVLIILVHGDVNKAMSQERRQAGHFHEQKTNHRDFDSQDFELIKLSLRQNTIAKRASNQAFAILIKHIKAKLGIFVWILLKNMTSEKQLTDEVLLNILNNRDKVEQYFLTQNLLKTNVLCNDWASVESDFIQRHDIDVAIGDVAFVFNADDFEAELETKILENPLHKSAKEIIAYHQTILEMTGYLDHKNKEQWLDEESIGSILTCLENNFFQAQVIWIALCKPCFPLDNKRDPMRLMHRRDARELILSKPAFATQLAKALQLLFQNGLHLNLSDSITRMIKHFPQYADKLAYIFQLPLNTCPFTEPTKIVDVECLLTLLEKMTEDNDGQGILAIYQHLRDLEQRNALSEESVKQAIVNWQTLHDQQVDSKSQYHDTKCDRPVALHEMRQYKEDYKKSIELSGGSQRNAR